MHLLRNEFQQHCCYGQKNCHPIEFRQVVYRVHVTRRTDLMLISQLHRWKLCNQTDWNAPKIVGSFSLVSGSQQCRRNLDGIS